MESKAAINVVAHLVDIRQMEDRLMIRWVTAIVSLIILTIIFLTVSTVAQAAANGIKLITREVHIEKAKSEAAQGNLMRLGVSGYDPDAVIPPEQLVKYDQIMPRTPVLSPDKRRMVYVILRDDNMYAVVDGVEQNAYYDIGTPPIFSPDSKRTAYAAVLKDKWVIVVDGVEGEKYDEIRQGLMFSPDSRRIVCIARRGDKQFAVVNGVELKKYKRVYNLKFSPDGE